LKSFILLNFQYFLKKHIIGCRLFITKLQPLELVFFNSITKFQTILYFESFSTSFYLLLFLLCCTIPNDVKFFRHVANLSRKKNPKKHHHFENEFECLYLAIYVVRFFANFITCSQVSILQDLVVTCVKKVVNFKILVLVLEMAVLEKRTFRRNCHLEYHICETHL